MDSERLKKGNVYLIPCTISDDTSDKVIPPHVTENLKNIKYFLAENIRTARRFISSLKLGINIEELQFEVLDKKTSSSEMKEYFKPVFEGNDMGILSEAGCPGIADPGSLAVNFAHQQNIRVVPLVGPSSILMALMASGFNGQSFVFHGYVPIDSAEREKFIKEVENQAKVKNQTQIFMETPYRNDKLLTDLLSFCHANTLLCIAKDVTGKDEMIHTQTIKNWKTKVPPLHKSPVIFLLYI